MIDAYLRALMKEIRRAAETHQFPNDTVYFGGGTPSLLPIKSLAEIFHLLSRHFAIEPDAEITLEANPGTLTGDPFAPNVNPNFIMMRDIGVNRLNIGVQSFDDDALRFLGRIHTAEAAIQAIEQTRNAGFDNLGIDLIYGLPEQTDADWEHQLETALRFRPEHISCYILTIEAGTPLHDDWRKGRFAPLPDHRVARMFGATIDILEANGYEHYEISNFARKFSDPAADFPRSYRSRHNRKYWNFVPYIGLGPSAHSFQKNRRWWNTRSLPNYIAALESGRLPIVESESLSREQEMVEAIYLGLRQADGVSIPAFEERFGVDFRNAFGDSLIRMADAGHLAVTGDRAFLTRTGMVLMDGVVQSLIGAL